ncbi:MAG: spiro-SPASM protein [Spirochaetia bacterium]|nr:spiro-SPASM protein [Spirochaetia bacterium]
MTDPSVKGILFFSESFCGYDPFLIQKNLSVIKLFPDAQIFSSHIDIADPPLKGSLMECLETASRSCCSEERDLILLVPGIFPLFDSSLFMEALKRHQRYLSHFTFTENIPPGILPDIVSFEFIEALSVEQKKNIKTWKDLRAFAVKNIDEFDFEIFYKSPDLRQYRLDFTCETERSGYAAKKFLEADPDLSYGGLENLILKQPEIIRPCPSYLEIAITDESPVSPVFMPNPETKKRLSGEQLQKILSEAALHPFKNDLTVSLSGTGEPLMYPDIISVIDQLISLDTLKLLYLETYGASWTADLLSDLKKISRPEKLNIILRLTTLDPRRYKQLYGSDLLETVLTSADSLKHQFPEIQLYAEMIKMTDVGDEVEAYFNYFEAKGIQVILSKFNRYIDLLQERRVSDLTPLHRDFCWHLARDVYVTSEGKIPVCRQDLFAEKHSYSLEKDGIYNSFQNNSLLFEKSIRSDYENSAMPCMKCDEWYTFMG